MAKPVTRKPSSSKAGRKDSTEAGSKADKSARKAAAKAEKPAKSAEPAASAPALKVTKPEAKSPLKAPVTKSASPPKPAKPAPATQPLVEERATLVEERAAEKPAAPSAAPSVAVAIAAEARAAAAKAAGMPADKSAKTARPGLVAIDGGRGSAPQPQASASAAPEGEDPFRFQAMDVERLSSNVARMVELGGKALAAYMKPRETGAHPAGSTETVTEVIKTLGQVAQYWLRDPMRTAQAQQDIAKQYIDLWTHSLKSFTGEPAEPVVKPEPKDGRFKDPEWDRNPFFAFLKQFYLMTSQLADKFVTQAELEEHLKHKAGFYLKQITNALSPSNFVPTNPELLRETIGSSGENLVRGLSMLAEDIERGGGDLMIRQSDESQFALGRNLAMTPGKVVFENDLMQLIQYDPATPKVGAVPLVIVPPWINKFYILDLVQDKSFIKWAVDQGLTVFVVSWVNPDERHAKKSFEDYMREGPLAAFQVACEITGQSQVHTIGYCVGGTLLAVTLAYMAAKGIDNVRTATFFTAQVDFTHAGDLKVFVDEEQIQTLEKRMAQTGYLEGKAMANAFNMLRSNDLIWSYVVNNYMKGKKPMPFDLLYWNADSPRMPAANHSFYLRHCYLQNDLSQGRMEVAGVKLDMKKVMVPVFNLASREDHIAPARSVFVGSSFFGGPVEYVLAGSGHIAGVVNPPAKMKYQHWTGGKPVGEFDTWLASAIEHPGSWWPHWREWIREHDGQEVEARPAGSAKYPPIEDAPGRYVKVKG